jgi:glycosyltransferase involved in cell wall biosynthesis
MSQRSVSVVIPALNEGENLVDTVACVLENSAWPDLQVIVADDGSTDGSPEAAASLAAERVHVLRCAAAGVAGARNAGAEAARGEVIVFLDGHCYVPSGWLAPLADALSQPGVGLVGPAFTNLTQPGVVACGMTWRDALLDNHWLPPGQEAAPVPLTIGACQAVNADAFRAVGMYDRGMTRWGSEDIELCLRMWLLGYEVIGQPGSLVHHHFRTSRNYEVDTALVLYNRLRLVLLHFDGDRLGRVLEPMLRMTGMAQGLSMAFDGDLPEVRRELFARRVHDMDWFCERFGITI